MAERETHVVTGAFGYSGKRIARRLLDAGHRVVTLTNSPDRPNPFGERVEVAPYDFDKPAALAETLAGATALYNTYWVRFDHKNFTHGEAVTNTLALFDAAKTAGVERLVHVSITNPDEHSKLPYFAGKGRLERALKESGLSHAILRPAVLFGGEDILINNIAWMIRRFPIFGMFGFGRYRLQPIHVDDLASLAVAQGALRENVTIDAIGPETFTYRELVRTLCRILGKHRLLLPLPPIVGFVCGWLLGKLLGDVLITRHEVRGLMADLLYADAPPAGTTKLTDWAKEHKDTLGRTYANEMRRRRNRQAAYTTP